MKLYLMKMVQLGNELLMTLSRNSIASTRLTMLDAKLVTIILTRSSRRSRTRKRKSSN
jgi:hypothetical protein